MNQIKISSKENKLCLLNNSCQAVLSDQADARKDAHVLRAESQAIMVGRTTKACAKGAVAERRAKVLVVGARTLVLASPLGARTLLGAKGIATTSKFFFSAW